MYEKPTNGKSSPEKPAAFRWREEGTARKFFSGSSKFEVSSSDFKVGTNGGGAGQKERNEDYNPGTCFISCTSTAACALSGTGRLSHCYEIYYSNKILTPALPPHRTIPSLTFLLSLDYCTCLAKVTISQGARQWLIYNDVCCYCSKSR